MIAHPTAQYVERMAQRFRLERTALIARGFPGGPCVAGRGASAVPVTLPRVPHRWEALAVVGHGAVKVRGVNREAAGPALCTGVNGH
jgi:hypothetical protein